MERPDIIEPEKEILDEFKDIMNTTGSKAKGKMLEPSLLIQGFTEKGRVMRYAFYRYEENIPLKRSAKENRSSELVKAQIQDIKVIPENFLILEVIPNNPINYILFKLFRYGARYHLVDKRFLSVDEDFNISLYAQQQRFYRNVYVYSGAAKDIVSYLVSHLTVKQILKDTVNHIPQMHYFDYKTGKFAAKSRELHDLKAKSWKEREENLEKEVDEE